MNLSFGIMRSAPVNTHTHMHSPHEEAPSVLVWVFVGTLLLPRLVVMVITVFLFRAKGFLKPTLLAKVYLSVALILSFLEEVPNSVLTVAPYFSSSSSVPQDCS